MCPSVVIDQIDSSCCRGSVFADARRRMFAAQRSSVA